MQQEQATIGFECASMLDLTILSANALWPKVSTERTYTYRSRVVLFSLYDIESWCTQLSDELFYTKVVNITNAFGRRSKCTVTFSCAIT